MSAIGQIFTGVSQANAVKEGASEQTAADYAALAQQQKQFDVTQANVDPYIQSGQDNLSSAQNFWQGTQANLGNAEVGVQQTMPGTMTQAELEQTPGYQFQLAQGEKAIQSSAAARGLGVSGAAINGADNYAQGLASSNYQQQFNNQQTRYSDAQGQFNNVLNGANTVYNQLYGPITTGANAANSLGSTSATVANNASTTLQNAGQAQSAGTIGSTTALNSGINNALSTTNNNANNLALLGALG